MILHIRRSPSIHSALAVLALGFLVACGPRSSAPSSGLSHRQFTDALHKVISADRITYTKKVIQRLVEEKKIVTATENFQDENTLPLPAQMLRMGAELVADDANAGFSYSLQSLWPINKSNATNQTEVEKKGLRHVVDHPKENFYGEETLGGKTYFTAVYPDVAVAQACVTCHNGHKDSPRTDFKVGDVMGGVVIRVPVSE